MIIWLDAQLSPTLAPWIETTFSVSTVALRDIGLRDAMDEDIFRAAKVAGAVVMTKDSDFLWLLDLFVPPPQVIWLTCGNTSNLRLKEILLQTFSPVLNLLANGEPMVEIRDTTLIP